MTTQRQIDRLTAIRAAEWYELVRSTAGEAPKEFMEWLESPPHMEAFMAIASEALAMRAVFKNGEFDVERLCSRASLQTPTVEPLQWRQRVSSAVSAPRVHGLRWYWGALAAGLCVLAIGGAGLMKLQGQQFDTQIGEQRILQLTDGSIVRLNARSHLEVNMSAREREIRLAGEALFKVAPDVHRPFRVHTGSATVQAVGTQFDVYERRDGSTLVSVLEGKVQVSTSTPNGVIPRLMTLDKKPTAATAVPLSAGEQARVGSTGGLITRNPAPDVAASTAWQDRKLIFKHSTIEEMVAEFNRYNALQLHLEDVPPHQFFYSGIFDADDPRALAHLLARDPELNIDQRDNEIVIRGRSQN